MCRKIKQGGIWKSPGDLVAHSRGQSRWGGCAREESLRSKWQRWGYTRCEITIEEFVLTQNESISPHCRSSVDRDKETGKQYSFSAEVLEGIYGRGEVRIITREAVGDETLIHHRFPYFRRRS